MLVFGAKELLSPLQLFYTWAQEAAVTSAERALQGVGGAMDINVCASALRLMSQILNWEFQGTNWVRSANGTVVMGKSKTNAFTSSIGRDTNNFKRPGDHASLVQVCMLEIVQPAIPWSRNIFIFAYFRMFCIICATISFLLS
jgi:hypothetical protein